MAKKDGTELSTALAGVEPADNNHSRVQAARVCQPAAAVPDEEGADAGGQLAAPLHSRGAGDALTSSGPV